MINEKMSKRVADCTSVEMRFDGSSFVGMNDYNSDFNVHHTELMCEDEDAWDKIITGLREELVRRKQGVVEVPEEPRKKTRKILIASTGQELGMTMGRIGDNAKLLEKLGDDVEFIDMANIPEGMTIEGLSKAELLEMGKPYLETLRSMPPKEFEFINHVEDMRYSHLSKKEREADVQPVRTEPKYQRNSPCPCGSGKKYKNCCINKA